MLKMEYIFTEKQIKQIMIDKKNNRLLTGLCKLITGKVTLETDEKYYLINYILGNKRIMCQNMIPNINFHKMDVVFGVL